MNTIKIHYGQEDLISRIPALFAYFEFDDNGVCNLHRAIDAVGGCYGKIVAGILFPTTYSSNYVTPGEVYSYRTLIDFYYQYKDDQSDGFIEFMNRGIGKVAVDIAIDWNICDLVPEFAYISECGGLYEEMKKMKLIIEAYEQIKSKTGEINCEMECLKDKYARMGGDIMLQFYYDRSKDAKDIAEEYFNIASKDIPTINCDICFVTNGKDLGYLSTYLNHFVPGQEYVVGEYVTYNNRTYLCTGDTKGQWNPEYEEYEFDPVNFTLLTELYGVTNTHYTGRTSSKLSGFKRKRNYLNSAGDIEIPSMGEDWLYYYRVGSLSHYETTTDELGNIMVLDGETRNLTIGGYETHLQAYGNIINNITYDEDQKLIFIEYYIGCNLKAKLIDIIVDDDGNERYLYDDYKYNKQDTHGIRFVEQYVYDTGGDIDTLINNGDFKDYVSNDNVSAQYAFQKMTFDTSETLSSVTTYYNGAPVTYDVNICEFEYDITDPKDSLVAPIMKVDYLTGITYPPEVQTDVFVSRGNAASWERHIKLGEVKTFNDLENYSNGGFFNLM